MNILFVNNFWHLFERFDSGASNRSTMFIRALAQIGHVDVISFTDNEVSNVENCDVIFSCSIQNSVSVKAKRLDKFLNLFRYNNPYSIYPIQPEKKKIVDFYLKQKKYDFVACRYIHEACWSGLLELADKLILDVDDAPRKVARINWKESIGKTSLQNTIYGFFNIATITKISKVVLSKVYVSFYSNINEKPYRKSIYLHNIALSDTQIPPITKDTPKSLLVVGLYDYFPNKNGLDHFLRNIFPLIKQKCPDIDLHIVGRCSDEELKLRWTSIDGVKVLGYVPSLSKEYEDCRAVIVPLYEGGGTSIKVLEAMRMSRPCVTTPIGIRGMENYIDKENDVLLALDDRSFADMVIQIVQSENLANYIAKNATLFVEKYFSHDKFIEIVKNNVLKNIPCPNS